MTKHTNAVFRDMNSKDKLFGCLWCDACFDTFKEVERHYRIVHNETLQTW